jgi:hypothetical protein
MNDPKEPSLSWGILQAVLLAMAFTIPIVIMALLPPPAVLFLEPFLGWSYIAIGLIRGLIGKLSLRGQ